MNKKARIFDMHAQTYHCARPGYPKEVYDLVAQSKEFGRSSTILEVGAGHGVATGEIVQYWHPNIDALEPGANLVKLLKARMAEYSNVQIYETGFEEYHCAGKRYDAIFSATAFHWIDKAVKYKKSYELLKPDGILVLYWNNYGIQDPAVARTITGLYRQYGFPRKDNKTAEEYLREKIENRKDEIVESGIFELVQHQEVVHSLEYSAEQYIGLLTTFSDHTPENIPDIEGMFSQIQEAIGDSIEVKIVVNVEIARKSLLLLYDCNERSEKSPSGAGYV